MSKLRNLIQNAERKVFGIKAKEPSTFNDCQFVPSDQPSRSSEIGSRSFVDQEMSRQARATRWFESGIRQEVQGEWLEPVNEIPPEQRAQLPRGRHWQQVSRDRAEHVVQEMNTYGINLSPSRVIYINNRDLGILYFESIVQHTMEAVERIIQWVAEASAIREAESLPVDVEVALFLLDTATDEYYHNIPAPAPQQPEPDRRGWRVVSENEARAAIQLRRDPASISRAFLITSNVFGTHWLITQNEHASEAVAEIFRQVHDILRIWENTSPEATLMDIQSLANELTERYYRDASPPQQHRRWRIVSREEAREAVSGDNPVGRVYLLRTTVLGDFWFLTRERHEQGAVAEIFLHVQNIISGWSPILEDSPMTPERMERIVNEETNRYYEEGPG